MSKIRTKPSCIRHLLLSVSLLWAILLTGQGTQALDSVPTCTSYTSTSVHFNPDFKLPGKLKKKGQHISTDANVSNPFVTNLLQEEAAPLPPIHCFAAPIDEFVPAYLTKQEGRSYIERLFLSSIQPNAP
ncbi:hypothetical protein OB13_10455 [Pontibacter sp. HJ8]